jgi:transcriptional regulator GlxA family with amidase domain
MLLAQAGLLDGKHATTWYGAIGRLREMTPQATVHEQTRFVDNGKIITTAGVSAGIDGALHVVEKLLGKEVAARTAKYMEYDKWHPREGLIFESVG